MNKEQITQALMFYAPRAKWMFDSDDLNVTYDNIVWNDMYFVKPSEKQLKEIYNLSTKTYSANSDFRLERSEEYPSLEDQLDTIYHEGVDVWKERITAVKNKYPKPS
jgi:hypothetical protein